MSKERPVDRKRRNVVTAFSLASAAVASAGVATPFAASLVPSRRTKGEGAPITLDLEILELGKVLVVPWRRKPVWVLLRTKEMIDSLAENVDRLADPASEGSLQPDSCVNETRSQKPEIFVALGVCTHLGCSPGINPPDGFLCACHGSHFDYAGRVFKGSPAPANLEIPAHHFTDENTLIVGVNASEA